MLHKVGCSGFPVARSRYFKALSAVEIASSFRQPPRLATARAWREEAPAGFDFSIAAWQLITHPESLVSFKGALKDIPPRRRAFCGHFKPTPEVSRAWEATEALALELKARFVVFETPRTFFADANHLRDMYRFFKSVGRKGPAMVWRPRAHWEPKMVSRVCGDLGLIFAADSLSASKTPGPVQYFRLAPPKEGELGDAELKAVAARCREKASYVFFAGRAAWRDARRYLALNGEG